MDFISSAKDPAEQLTALTDFSVKEIEYICDKIGPRPCGEDGETKAQEYLRGKIAAYADCAARETYEVHPDAFMGFVPVAGSLLLGATAAKPAEKPAAKPKAAKKK